MSEVMNLSQVAKYAGMPKSRLKVWLSRRKINLDGADLPGVPTAHAQCSLGFAERIRITNAITTTLGLGPEIADVIAQSIVDGGSFKLEVEGVFQVAFEKSKAA